MNNRTIKFRAWLPELGVMVYSDDQASLDCCEVWQFDPYGIHVEIQQEVWKESGGETVEEIRYITPKQNVMQFTGLVDKHGKEIWEGDRVVCGYGVGIVKFRNGCFIVEWEDDTEADDEFLYTRKGRYVRTGDEEFSVTGNIHDEKPHGNGE